MQHLNLTLPAQVESTVPVTIGSGAAHTISETVSTLQPDAVFVLHDEGVESIATAIAASIPESVTIPVASGEASKSLSEVERLCRALLENQCSRKSLLIVVGGGMMTDLGAFVASVFMRGIDFVLVPTTLLCMTDAGIGGKTGVDIGTTKNIVGTFCHPSAIVMDTDFLQTLPDAAIGEGLTEFAKMAAMLDAEIFAWIEDNVAGLLARDPELLTQAIAYAVSLKSAVVSADEKEGGNRKFLNFGHTIGHAIEADSQFALSHGAAVSIGMVAEMQITECPDTDRVSALLTAMGMPTSMPEEADREVLWDLMLNDKKTVDGTPVVAVPSSLGAGHILSLTKEQFLSLV